MEYSAFKESIFFTDANAEFLILTRDINEKETQKLLITLNTLQIHIMSQLSLAPVCLATF